MNISSVQSYTSLFEVKENVAFRSAEQQNTQAETNNDITTVQTKNETQKPDDKDENKEKLKGSASTEELTQGEKQQISQLQQRDSEVRAHEAAHIAAGGSAVSGAASFTYQKGPDEKLYAIGGEVPINTAGGNTPQEKIAAAKAVQAGALAPASPSPQDLKVASSAAMMEAQARQELNLERSEALKDKAINTYNENQNSNNDSQGEGLKLQA